MPVLFRAASRGGCEMFLLCVRSFCRGLNGRGCVQTLAPGTPLDVWGGGTCRAVAPPGNPPSRRTGFSAAGGLLASPPPSAVQRLAKTAPRDVQLAQVTACPAAGPLAMRPDAQLPGVLAPESPRACAGGALPSTCGSRNGQNGAHGAGFLAAAVGRGLSVRWSAPQKMAQADAVAAPGAFQQRFMHHVLFVWLGWELRAHSRPFGVRMPCCGQGGRLFSSGGGRIRPGGLQRSSRSLPRRT